MPTVTLGCEPLFQPLVFCRVVGLVHLAIVIMAAFLALPPLIRSRRTYWGFIRGFTVFNALLLLCGTCTNVLWDAVVVRRINISIVLVFALATWITSVFLYSRIQFPIRRASRYFWSMPNWSNHSGNANRC